MSWSARLRRVFLGKKLDPMRAGTRKHMVLIAFFAWIGLGADGLSSACYGPEESFLALGGNDQMALFLALMTAVTVFVIAIGYNQVIELFPSGGGGYRAATRLIGPYAGLVSGGALLVDYVLTIALSVSSGGDAVFSLLSVGAQQWKFTAEIGALLVLVLLNLRGMKESIKVLMPIFLGFFITHLALIGYGVGHHALRIPALLPDAVSDMHHMAGNVGWLVVASLFLRAYSLGGGTYTGLEAVSNNVNMLVEPRVRTGRWTMFYMATSLALTAGGIILLYLLWNVHAQPDKTLNAVVFQSIIASLNLGSPELAHAALAVVLALEGGLLMVGANTGFMGGPAVLATMAEDRWVPRQFRQLSSRMVTQNGVLVMGVAALAILVASHGSVAFLVVLYSINVFLTFSLTMYGLSRHWWRQHPYLLHWRRRLAVALLGAVVCGFILIVTTVEKFTDGGWLTLLVTAAVITACLFIKRHYDHVGRLMKRVDDQYSKKIDWDESLPCLPIDRSKPTAVILVGANRGAAMYTLSQALHTFPGRFANYVFASVGEVDKQNFGADGALLNLRATIDNALHYFTSYCTSKDLPATAYSAFGGDPLAELEHLGDTICNDFPHTVFFAGKLVFPREGWWIRLLHNQLPLAMQRRLERRQRQMVVVPLRVPEPATPSRAPGGWHIR
ncbi:MAG TPA: APC family permease [Nevskiaceae bacterium]|nr:APC family permease [Nevskiaceae bacterium]